MNNSFVFIFAVQFDHIDIAIFIYEKRARPNEHTLTIARIL